MNKILFSPQKNLIFTKNLTLNVNAQMTNRPKAIVAVTNDLTTDQRAHKICTTLLSLNYNVVLVGRLKKDSLPLQTQAYATKRFKLWFNKGAFFYANYNIRLFFFLLFSKQSLIWSNDLDTLPTCFLASKMKSNTLVFDSHEYFTEVPELIPRPKIQAFWKKIERFILPQLTKVITVCNGIAEIYRKEYNIDVKVVRNVPFLKASSPLSKKSEKIILYQGAINVNRGIETMVKAMQYIDGATLQLIGKGDISASIQQLIEQLDLKDKVIMLGEIPYQELKNYTQQATIGLSLEENVGLNYQLALPNKLFDYIHAEIPVLVADLPEMSTLVKQYQLGEVAQSTDPKVLANQLNEMLKNEPQLNSWKANAAKAKQELNWEKESEIIKEVLNFKF